MKTLLKTISLLTLFCMLMISCGDSNRTNKLASHPQQGLIEQSEQDKLLSKARRILQEHRNLEVSNKIVSDVAISVFKISQTNSNTSIANSATSIVDGLDSCKGNCDVTKIIEQKGGKGWGKPIERLKTLKNRLTKISQQNPSDSTYSLGLKSNLSAWFNEQTISENGKDSIYRKLSKNIDSYVNSTNEWQKNNLPLQIIAAPKSVAKTADSTLNYLIRILIVILITALGVFAWLYIKKTKEIIKLHNLLISTESISKLQYGIDINFRDRKPFPINTYGLIFNKLDTELKKTDNASKVTDYGPIIDELKRIVNVNDPYQLAGIVKTLQREIEDKQKETSAGINEDNNRQHSWHLSTTEEKSRSELHSVFYLDEPISEGLFDDNRYENNNGDHTFYRFKLNNPKSATFTFEARPDRVASALNSRTSCIDPVCEVLGGQLVNPQEVKNKPNGEGKAELIDRHWHVRIKAKVYFD